MAVALASCGETPVAVVDAGAVDASVGPRCPTHLRFTFVEGNRTDVGWTGNLHGSTISKDAFFRAAITECDASCRNCAFEGPVRAADINTQRCLADSSLTCSTDADCPPWECRVADANKPELGRVCSDASNRPCTTAAECGPSACRFFVGPSFPISAPRTCVSTFLDALRNDGGRPPVKGTIDLASGRVNMERFTLGIGTVDSAIQGACPVCVGDPRANDGVKGGTCAVNPTAPVFPYDGAQACDTNGFGQLSGYQFQYSLDCTAPLGRSIVFDVRGANTGGVRFELGEQQPTCGGGRCWCGVCEGSFRPCHSAGDCSGTACVAATDEYSGPNSCVTPCEWDTATQRGVCWTQDPARDDGGLPPRRRVSCFPADLGSELVAQGGSRVLSSEEFSIQLANVTCAPPVRALSMSEAAKTADRQIGLPGPMLNVYKLNVTKEYAQ